MDESTTTEASVVDSGANIAQPDAPETQSAASTPETETQTQVQGQEEPQSDDNSEWLQSKGIDLSTEEGQAKLAKSYRELEKSYSQKSQKAAELEKSMVSGFDEAVQNEVSNGTLEADDPRIAIRKLEIKQNVRDFFDGKPEAKPYEQDMIKIVQGKPHLAGDLDALYALARTSDESSVKSEAGREALESLADKQRATAPTGRAVNPMGTNSNKITPQNVNQLVGQNDLAWYESHREEINRAIAGN
jgi:hypothetical protein